MLNDDLTDLKISAYYNNYKTQILENLHSVDIIKQYTINHDVGKPYTITFDEDGKKHYVNHSQKSKEIWLTSNGDPIVGNLIGNDLLFHTKKYDEIRELNLPIKDICTHLVVALAELHANAALFGGITSESFCIKFKKLEKLGNKLGESLFNHSYIYVIVRKDLSSAQRAVQSSHACIESARTFLKKDDEHPSVIICEVKSENKLKMIMAELDGKVNYKTFQESDLDNQYTALATEPIKGETRKLFSRFQLIS